MSKKKDFIAEAIADYESMSSTEQGQMVVTVLEDQPILMGFITNLADDFSDSQHEILVDSVIILINAFIAKGIVVEMIPHQIVEEVIREKVEAYDDIKGDDETDPEVAEGVVDSPLVYEDLRNYALFKSNLAEEQQETQQNFGVVLNTIISIIERSVAAEIQKQSK